MTERPEHTILHVDNEKRWFWFFFGKTATWYGKRWPFHSNDILVCESDHLRSMPTIDAWMPPNYYGA